MVVDGSIDRTIDRSAARPVPVRNLYLPTDRFSNMRNTCLEGNVRHLETFPRIGRCKRDYPWMNIFPWSTVACARDSIDRLSNVETLPFTCDRSRSLDVRQWRSTTAAAAAAAASAWQSSRERKLRVKKRVHRAGHTYRVYVNLRTGSIYGTLKPVRTVFSLAASAAERRENRVTASGRNESSDSVTSAGSRTQPALTVIVDPRSSSHRVFRPRNTHETRTCVSRARETQLGEETRENEREWFITKNK